jgi:IS1 family transposase
VQLDEKWSFVGKKEKNCDRAEEADCLRGDVWDHGALDPDSRLVLEALIGPRTDDMAELLLEGVRDRLDERVPPLVVSDEYSAYRKALLSVFGEERTPPPTGRPGRPPGPRLAPPEGMCYATVPKTREHGRVTAVDERVLFGELGEGDVVSTSYLERHNATDRHRNARKGRKTYRFSKDWEVHEAMTHFTMFSYNFCWPVRTLRVRDEGGRWHQRTPAMVAALTDHVWSLIEWLTFPGVQR